ncbi:hypothetical protein Tco_1571703, partial [Tanacetum coccineum]
MIAYCLITGTKVDIEEIIYSDLVTKLTGMSRQKYVSYPRFILCALEVLLGSQYTQDEIFGSLLNIMSNSNFSDDLSKSPKASGALSKKRQNPKSNKTPTETQVTLPTGPTEGSKQSHSVSSGNASDDEEVFATGEEMDDEIPPTNEEFKSAPPNTDKPESSHAQDTDELASDSSSLE